MIPPVMIAQEFGLIEAIATQLTLVCPPSQFTVGLQLFFRFKRPIAKRTPIASVDVHMALQRVHRVKHLSTDRANTSVVPFDVLIQISSLLVAFATKLTHVGPLLCVHLPNVLLGVRRIRQYRRTERTFDSRPGVLEDMIVQRYLLRESYRTVRTLVRFLTGVRPHVYLKSTLLHEAHVTVFALEVLDTEVNLLVQPQVSYVLGDLSTHIARKSAF